MTQDLDRAEVRGMLAIAQLTTACLQRMTELVAEYEGNNFHSDNCETERLLATANAVLERWRIETGVREGVLVLKQVEDWYDDEFD